jgi:NAD-dependent SIR2 family protein deacetylase
MGYREQVGTLVKAYCVKCKKSVEMKDPKKVKLKNGKPATKGSCPKCGTKVFRIGG